MNAHEHISIMWLERVETTAMDYNGTKNIWQGKNNWQNPRYVGYNWQNIIEGLDIIAE